MTVYDFTLIDGNGNDAIDNDGGAVYIQAGRIEGVVYNLAEGEGEQFKECTPSSERLCDCLLEDWLVRPREDELSGDVPTFVNYRLYRRCEFRYPLDFVDYKRCLVHVKETTIVVFCQLTRLRVFEIDIPIVRKTRLCERRLAGLPWSGNCQHGKFPRTLLRYFRHLSKNHVVSLCMSE